MATQSPELDLCDRVCVSETGVTVVSLEFLTEGSLFTAVKQVPSACLHGGEMFNRGVCVPVLS